MKTLRRSSITIVLLLIVTASASVVIGRMNRGAASADAVVFAAAAPMATEGSRQGGSQYSMPLATISSGGVVFTNGSFAIIGQPLVGTISNANYSMQVGAVPILAGVAVPGDFDGDGDSDLDDYAVFFQCMAGPNASPSPPPPTTAQECLDVFDFDADLDVDLFDSGDFLVGFTGA